MDLNMNQFDFLINGPEYEPQLVYRVWTKIWYSSNEPKYDIQKALNLWQTKGLDFLVHLK